MHPRMQFALLTAREHCWLPLSLLSTAPLDPFLQLVLQPLFQIILVLAVTPSQGRIQYLDLLNLILLIIAQCSSLSRFLFLLKDIKLIKHNFPFLSPCWLCLMMTLFFKCLPVVPGIILYVFSPETEARHNRSVIPWVCPHTLLYMGTTLASFQSVRTSPDSQELRLMIERGPAMISASALRTLISSGSWIRKKNYTDTSGLPWTCQLPCGNSPCPTRPFIHLPALSVIDYWQILVENRQSLLQLNSWAVKVHFLGWQVTFLCVEQCLLSKVFSFFLLSSVAWSGKPTEGETEQNI